jgi:hypothetical protein
MEAEPASYACRAIEQVSRLFPQTDFYEYMALAKTHGEEEATRILGDRLAAAPAAPAASPAASPRSELLAVTPATPDQPIKTQDKPPPAPRRPHIEARRRA